MTENMYALFNRRNFPIILIYMGWWLLDYQNVIVYFVVWFLLALSISKVLIGGGELNYINTFVISIAVFVISLKV